MRTIDCLLCVTTFFTCMASMCSGEKRNQICTGTGAATPGVPEDIPKQEREFVANLRVSVGLVAELNITWCLVKHKFPAKRMSVTGAFYHVRNFEQNWHGKTITQNCHEKTMQKLAR